MPTQRLQFTEWLPDQPANAGSLNDAGKGAGIVYFYPYNVMKKDLKIWVFLGMMERN
jgi:hypothetical protein